MQEENQSSRIAKNTLILYVRLLFTMLVALYTSRLILNALGAEDYGIYNVVGGVVTIFSFLNTAMASSTQRFINYNLGQNNFKRLNDIFNTSIIIHFCFAIIIIIFAETIGLWFLNTQINIPESKILDANIIYQFSIFTTILSLMQAPFLAAIIAYERMNIYAYIGIIEALIKLICAIALTLLFTSYKLPIYGALVFFTYSISFLLYFIYVKKNISLGQFKIVKDKQSYNNLLGFTSWTIFGGVANVLNTQGQNILLNIFAGPIANAARGISIQVTQALYLFINGFQTSINPQIVKSYASNEIPYFQKLVKTSAKGSFYLFSILAIPVLLEIEQILIIWLKQVPEHTTTFCRLVIINSLLNTLSGPLITSASASGNIKKFQLFVNLIFICNLPISYLFLRAGYPPEIVYYTAIIAELSALFCRLIIVSRIVPINLKSYIYDVIIRCLLVFLLTYMFSYYFHSFFNYGIERLAATFVISILFSCFIVFFIGLNREEQDYIKARIKKHENSI